MVRDRNRDLLLTDLRHRDSDLKGYAHLDRDWNRNRNFNVVDDFTGDDHFVVHILNVLGQTDRSSSDAVGNGSTKELRVGSLSVARNISISEETKIRTTERT